MTTTPASSPSRPHDPSAGFRVGHCADLHLGYQAGTRKTGRQVNVRVDDGYRAFTEMVDQMVARRVDAVVVCGDVFHIPKPDVQSILVAQTEFRRLADAGIRVYILAGNHDQNDEAADVAASRILHDPDRGIWSHVEPYITHQVTDGLVLHLISHHGFAAQGALMSQIRRADGQHNILATHGSVMDPLLAYILSTPQSPREIIIGDPLLLEHGWANVLLGHIHHRHQVVHPADRYPGMAIPRIDYAGSLLRRGFADEPGDRGWTEWTLTEAGLGDPVYHDVWQRPQHDFPTIDADGLTGDDLTGLILDRLGEHNPNPDGQPTYAGDEAPLLRQVIVNTGPGVSDTIDRLALAGAAGYALRWDMVVQPANLAQFTDALWDPRDPQDADTGPDRAEQPSGSASMVDQFRYWVEDNPVIHQIADHLRVPATDRAADVIATTQEQFLDTNTEP